MLGTAAEALNRLLQPDVFVFLPLGVLIGTLIGILPGLGGIVGMSLLVPFVFGMDPTAGLALLVGMVAVTNTSDTYPSVMLGVPGSTAAQATIMDGYPMARQGRGAEALSAAFFASMIGGLIGAGFLFVAVFSAQPIILAFKSPELFMLVILGVALVGVLSRGATLAGLMVGCVGLILGAVGGAPTAPVYRYAEGGLYLYSGIPLAIVGMGLFALPEIYDLLVKRRSVVGVNKLEGSQLAGIKAVLKSKWLIVRSSAIGTIVGILPGVGGVHDWLAYAIAKQTSKNTEGFGKGDVRGVIAPESANNANEGGALVPTLLFGIPGSTSMAIMLGGMTLMGIEAGPQLLSTNMPLVVSIAWMLVIANVLATGLCLTLTRPMVRLTTVPAQVFAPFLIVLLVMASYQSTRHWGDIAALFTFGVVGWVMKHVRWPRPPLLIGFVLSEPAERYLMTTSATYGWSWLARPGVIIIGVIIIAVLVSTMRKTKSVSIEERVIAENAPNMENALNADHVESAEKAENVERGENVDRDAPKPKESE